MTVIKAEKLNYRSASFPHPKSDWYTIKGAEYQWALFAFMSRNREKIIQNQWFQYEDESGSHRCQIDIIAFTEETQYLSVLESKINLHSERFSKARSKMTNIYIPVTKLAYKTQNVGGVVVFLRGDITKIPKHHPNHPSIEDATRWSIENNEAAFFQWRQPNLHAISRPPTFSLNTLLNSGEFVKRRSNKSCG